jgi:integrase
VTLPAPVLDALREHKARRAANRLALGESWTESGLVFTTGFGTPIEPRNLNRHWINTRTKLGLDHVRFHDLSGTRPSRS